MSLPRYSKYENSEVKWLGEVPAHWDRARLAALFREVSEPGTDDLPILSVSIHDGVSDKELDEHEAERKVSRSEDRSKYKAVAPGDLTYNMMRAWQGGFGTVTVHGMVSPAYVVARPTARFLTSHVEMLLRTPMAVAEMKRHSRGITDFRLRLYWEDFKCIRIALPPYAEQLGIATFLDCEAGKINALIAEQEKLIALLAEKRQTTISHAVTRGLNPDAPTKDSGVEWLGEVPAHWVLPPLYLRYEASLGKMLDTSQITGRHLVRYLRNVDVQWDAINIVDLPEMDIESSDLERYTVRSGDLLVCEGGEVGRAAVASDICGSLGYQKALHRLRAITTDECPRFMYYTLRWASNAGAFSGEGQSTIAHLTGEQLRKYRFPKPPIEEQHQVVTFLDAETTKLDALASKAERTIGLLKERRGALIAAAVTGQIDVSGAVPQPAAHEELVT